MGEEWGEMMCNVSYALYYIELAASVGAIPMR